MPAMHRKLFCLLLSGSLAFLARADTPAERLGTVSFPVSCAPASQVPFNRGVALLHDFWYEEAESQFHALLKTDPACAMAHWGVAMSQFHQIWDRPDKATMSAGAVELEKAHAGQAKTEREKDYIAALSAFYQPGPADYPARIAGYASAMAALANRYPEDPDAQSFSALAVLASEEPSDTSLSHERRALALLLPLSAKYPDHPGIAHYIIHAGDNPALASQALPAAQRYGAIAPSAPHAVHMPGHIFARLGMWQPDIDVNLQSVAASRSAQERHLSGGFDQLHADDFLLYAYLQAGQDGAAEALVASTDATLNSFAEMPAMHGMSGMVSYYRTKLPVFYSLERRDWSAALNLKPVPGEKPLPQLVTAWAHAVAAGHLHDAPAARSALSTCETLVEQIRHTPQAYMVESSGFVIMIDEVEAWASFAAGHPDQALAQMIKAADLQDKVGQGEVDIPAREMLADMLLDLHKPAAALEAYRAALLLSPNRFNALYHAGEAAEALHNAPAAARYYVALLASTGNGVQCKRPEIAHARSVIATSPLATR